MISSASWAASRHASGTLTTVGAARWSLVVAVVVVVVDGWRRRLRVVATLGQDPAEGGAGDEQQRQRGHPPPAGAALEGRGSGAAGAAGSADCRARSDSSASAGSNREPMRAPISAKLRRISSSSRCWRSCSSRSVAISPKAWTNGGERRPGSRSRTGQDRKCLASGKVTTSRHTPANRQTYVVLAVPPLVCTTGSIRGAARSPVRPAGQRSGSGRRAWPSGPAPPGPPRPAGR